MGGHRGRGGGWRWLPRLMALCGVALLCGPFLADALRAADDDALIEAYETEVMTMDREMIDGAVADAVAYNEELRARGDNYRLAARVQDLVDRSHRAGAGGDERSFITDDEAGRQYLRYRALLAVANSPIMGSLTIGALGLRVPIYHGTADEELQKGAGHLIGSSLPVGGPGTHCVLVAHSGLPSAELFSHLSDLRAGDRFTITVLDRRLAYEVDQMLVVTPEHTEELAIIEGRDLCTLVTCTPYGINSHRLLVRGHRVDPADETCPMASDGGWAGSALLLALGGAVSATVVIGLVRRARRKRRYFRW